MKNKELIEKLQKFDPESEVLFVDDTFFRSEMDHIWQKDSEILICSTDQPIGEDFDPESKGELWYPENRGY